MGKIFYSCSGEGRGHASRARTIIEDLKDRHEITVYAPEHAYDLLAPIYKESEVQVKRIPGLVFQYNQWKKLDYIKTFVKSADFIFQIPNNVDVIYQDIEREKPDLIVTDFEPLLPRAAEKYGIPYISVDHQHFLLSYDLSSLPLLQQQMAAFMAPSLNLFYTKQQETVVSAFYFPPLKNTVEHVHQVGIFLSKSVREVTPHKGDHILVYMRRHLEDAILSSLENSGHKVIIYTNESASNYGNITFKKISPTGFIEDLASCRALVSTAGNQLVGEALYFGKPVLSMPEPGNYEQEINGHFLQQSGGGKNIYMHTIDDSTVKSFMDEREKYIDVVDRNKLIGNYKAYRVMEKYLKSTPLVASQNIGRAVS